MRRTWKPLAIALLLAVVAGASLVKAQQPAADIVLTGGKIITVDEKFSIAQAVAIRGDRIVAVGTNQQINALAGPQTRRIDLRGRSVMPGFIDNHAHYQEEGAYWTEELRLDGVDSRKQALGDDPGARQAAGTERLDLHARRLVARPVPRRFESAHARRARQDRAEQPGLPPVHARVVLPEQQGDRDDRHGEDDRRRPSSGTRTGAPRGSSTAMPSAGACGTPRGSSRTCRRGSSSRAACRCSRTSPPRA